MNDEKSKDIIVYVPGAGDKASRNVEVAPGATVRDVTSHLGLHGYWLKKPGADGFFGADEPIYGAIKDGEKLEASSPAEVGQCDEC